MNNEMGTGTTSQCRGLWQAELDNTGQPFRTDTVEMECSVGLALPLWFRPGPRALVPSPPGGPQVDMHSPVPVREAPSRGKGEVNGNKFQKKQRGSRGLCPQPWLPPDHPPLAAGGKPQTSKAEATGRPRTRQGREGECEGGRPAGDGMQVDSLAGRRLSSARHRRGQTERRVVLGRVLGRGQGRGQGS